MPCFKMVTNLSKSSIPNDFLKKLTHVLAKSVKKDVSKFVVAVSTDSQVTVGGHDGPNVVATIESIGHLGPQENKIIAKEITEFIGKELGVKSEHILLTFYDLQAYNVAKNAVTCE